VKWLDRRIAAPGPYLTLCLSEKQYHKAMAHCKVDHSPPWINEGANAMTHILTRDGEVTCVVCIQKTKRHPVEIAGLLVHESGHVWQQYLIRIGERNPGDEQMAYGVQSISQELLNEYNRKARLFVDE
jgi:hypothetical protein